MNKYDYVEQVNLSFSFPLACFKYKDLIESESSTLADFANVISVDPLLTYRILKIANSAMYCFNQEISTISKAISMLGIQAIYNMMLIDASNRVINKFSNKSINITEFWRRSLFCGLATKNLSFKMGINDVERLFITGLLHNLGALVVSNLTPDIYEQCENNENGLSPEKRQQKILGFTYTDLSADLLKIWKFPEKIIIPIRHINHAQTIQINKDIKVLHVASCLAYIDSVAIELNPKESIDKYLCDILRLEHKDINEAFLYAYREVDNILLLMKAA
jgi:HD-like signal output (HDOD) protein